MNSVKYSAYLKLPAPAARRAYASRRWAKVFGFVLLASSGLSYEAGKQIGLPGPGNVQIQQADAATRVSNSGAVPAPAASPTPAPPSPPVVAAPVVAPPATPAAVPAPAVKPAATAAPVPVQRVAVQSSYPNLYTYGQCTYYIATRRPVPPLWGNANAWYSRAQASGWAVGAEPRVGAIAWTGVGAYGHLALVEKIDGPQIYISEMNYNGNWNRVTYRWASAASFRYIY